MTSRQTARQRAAAGMSATRCATCALPCTGQRTLPPDGRIRSAGQNHVVMARHAAQLPPSVMVQTTPSAASADWFRSDEPMDRLPPIYSQTMTASVGRASAPIRLPLLTSSAIFFYSLRSRGHPFAAGPRGKMRSSSSGVVSAARCPPSDGKRGKGRPNKTALDSSASKRG